ncbi:hypothetical protein [Mesorhizobium sp. M1406]|uniref:hypothetical protein n=1 Tax=Mesorhizobium sp. M1406 TaxID=2957099 RepID=UPI0033362F46
MQELSMREKAQFILLIFKGQGMKPGDVLQQKTLLHASAIYDMSAKEVAEGINEAFENVWVDGTPKGSVALTEAGWRKIQALD